MLMTHCKKINIFFKRRSKRNFDKYPISFREVNDIIQNSYGVSGFQKYAYGVEKLPLRTAPTSGGLQCVELFVLLNYSSDYKPSILHYNLLDCNLYLVSEMYNPASLIDICKGNEFAYSASMIICLVADLSKVFWKYGEGSLRLSFLDCGFIAQNVYLSSAYFGFKACAIGGFDIQALSEMLSLSDFQIPTLLVAVGR